MFNKLSELLGWFHLRSISEKDDNDMFWFSRFDKDKKQFITPYSNLPGKQIDAILAIVEKEIIKSYRLGLRISREQMLKEKAAVLSVFNEKGGGLLINVSKIKFEDASRLFSGLVKELMQEELGTGMGTVYKCHLESVVSSILEAIHDKKIPFL